MSFLNPSMVFSQAKINPDDPDWQRVYADIRKVISKNRADTAYLTSTVVLDEFLAHLPAEIIEAIWFGIRYTYKIADPLLDEENPLEAATDAFIKHELEKRGEEK